MRLKNWSAAGATGSVPEPDDDDMTPDVEVAPELHVPHHRSHAGEFLASSADQHFSRAWEMQERHQLRYGRMPVRPRQTPEEPEVAVEVAPDRREEAEESLEEDALPPLLRRLLERIRGRSLRSELAGGLARVRSGVLEKIADYGVRLETGSLPGYADKIIRVADGQALPLLKGVGMAYDQLRGRGSFASQSALAVLAVMAGTELAPQEFFGEQFALFVLGKSDLPLHGFLDYILAQETA